MSEDKNEYGVGFGPDDHVSASEAAGASMTDEVAARAMLQGLGENSGRMAEKEKGSFLDSSDDDAEVDYEDQKDEG